MNRRFRILCCIVGSVIVAACGGGGLSNQPKAAQGIAEISRLVSGSRAYGGLTHVVISANRLILDFQDEERRQGDCCSLGFVQMTYRLDGGSFREAGPRTKGSYCINFYPLYVGEPGSVQPSADGNIVVIDSVGVSARCGKEC